jgi:predicted ribosome quality control (RQC) complex YloA/Tae2 family protein
MERRSNIILVDDDNVILESVKRVTARMSQRVILPRQPYEFPPRQDKRDPRTATASGLASLCEQAQPDLVRALVATYRGISPQAAREVVFRVLDQTKVSIINTDNADNADNAGGTDSASRPDLPWEALAAALREICTADWQPTLVPGADDETGGDKPQAYAPYRLTHLRGAEPQPSMSSALEAFYGPREAVTAHQQRRDAVQQQLATARERLAHQLAQIEAELARVENVDRLRWEGEMIFAFMHTLSPGQTVLEVEGEQIALDPERSPVEEAQSRFQAYQKAQSGQERLHERQRETANQLAGIDQLAALLAVADEREQIDLIAQEAAEQGYIAPQKSAKAKAGKGRKGQRPVRRKPLHLVSSDGYDIYVGRSATQNAEVTFRLGRPDDLWLHVRTIPGAHVIVRSGGGEVPERTLREAAGVAAYFSGARGEASVDVELSRRKQVRKIPGAAPGLVSYRAERTLRVAPLLPWGS